jgi:hypothetical protein
MLWKELLVLVGFFNLILPTLSGDIIFFDILCKIFITKLSPSRQAHRGAEFFFVSDTAIPEP